MDLSLLAHLLFSLLYALWCQCLLLCQPVVREGSERNLFVGLNGVSWILLNALVEYALREFVNFFAMLLRRFIDLISPTRSHSRAWSVDLRNSSKGDVRLLHARACLPALYILAHQFTVDFHSDRLKSSVHFRVQFVENLLG